ncbi:MAG: sensor domain-containing diguanylate cyclase [Gemmataceae bacterium]
MTPAPLPANEPERLRALEGLRLLDTLPEQSYDDLARLASVVCGTPIAVISLIDRHRQWFKSKVGLDADQTGRDIAFCAHAILGDDVLEVPDAAGDARFADNPSVTGGPRIRFYAGTPLSTPDGHNVGTLCVIDRAPRQLAPAQVEALRCLARQVNALLRLRIQVAALERAEAKVRAEEERFRAFMDNSPAVAFMKDEAGRMVYVNDPLCRRFRITPADWLGKTGEELFPPDVARTIRDNDDAVLAGGRPVKLLEVVPTPDGEPHYWQSYKFPLTDGGIRYLAGMALDVTEEQRAERPLRESEEKFRRVVERLAEAVLLIDPDTKTVLEANDATLRLYGYPADEIPGLTLYDLSTHDRASVDANCRRTSELGHHAVGRRHRRRDGSLLEVELGASEVTHGGRRVLAVVVRDVTDERRYRHELEEANAQLHALARTDGLTGIPNRPAFDARLADESAMAERTGRPLSVLLFDVDHFKAFNDAFGHPAGDDVLRAVAGLLRGAARVTDLVGRYGGEEFVAVLPDTDAEGALAVAERCRQAVAEAGWALRPVTVSAGAATLTDGGDAAALVDAADRALYRSKRDGRDRVTHAGGHAVSYA